MPLAVVEAAHVRVTCDACRSVSAEVCGKRQLAIATRLAAVQRFREAGWHHDAGYHSRSKTQDDVDRDGSGRWYCPSCGKRRP